MGPVDDRNPGAPRALDPEALFAVLVRHGVRFVLIDAYAAVVRGWSEPTSDLDITPDAEIRNLARLAEALREIDAVALTPSGDPDPGWPIDDQHLRLRGTTFLSTRHGDLDIVLNPAAADGYADLARASESFVLRLGSIEVRVANLERVIASKRACNRPKDRDAVPRLEVLLRRLRDNAS